MGSLQLLTMPEKQELFLIALDSTRGNISAACAIIDISRTTFYKWMNDDSEGGFAERFQVVKHNSIEERLDVAESMLDQNVEKGISADIKYFLDNHGGRRGYGKKRVEVDFNVHSDPLMPVGEFPEEPEDVDQWEKLRDAAVTEIPEHAESLSEQSQ